MGKKMHGRSAPSKILKVPVGTIVWPAEDRKRPAPNAQRSTPNSDESAISNQQSAIEPLVDLTRDGQEFVLRQGGAGGQGPRHFKISLNRAPRERTGPEARGQGHFLFGVR